MGGHGRPSDAPAMLDRSHRKLEERLDELAGAAAMFRSTGDASALDVARDVLRFLRKSATRHENDEERSVFPRLGGRGSRELVAVLTAEHREHATMIDELGRILGEVAVSASRLVQVASALERMYADHVAREEAELMPRVRDLDADTLEDIFAEMQARRGR